MSPLAPTGDSIDQPVDLDRLRRTTRRRAVGVLYGIGAFVVAQVLVLGPGGPVAVLAAGGAACASVAAARLVAGAVRDHDAHHDVRPTDRRGWLVAVAVAGAVALTTASQLVDLVDADFSAPAHSGLIQGAVVGAVAVAVARRRLIVVGAGALIATALSLGARTVVAGGPDLWSAAFDGLVAALLGGTVVVQIVYWQMMVGLDRARHVERELAVANERLRFAEDLHEVHGRHLQDIAAHSELAAQLTEGDPRAVTEHMTEAAGRARAALDATRAVVQGYRRTSLPAELANAARILAAAGVDARIEPGTAELADEIADPARGLLGSVVRELTANAVGRQPIRRARFALETDRQHARLRVCYDGAGAGDLSSAEETGLDVAALHERAVRLGGGVRSEATGGWVTVTATVPFGEEPRDDPTSHPAAAGRR